MNPSQEKNYVISKYKYYINKQFIVCLFKIYNILKNSTPTSIFLSFIIYYY